MNERKQPKRYCSGPQVLERYGGRSSMWLWRHVKFDPKFPRPVVISGRRYFDEALLDEYDDSMRSAADNAEGT